MNSKNKNGFKVKEKIRIAFFRSSISSAKGLYYTTNLQKNLPPSQNFSNSSL
ncbi:hypothetical protein LEP1GSC016_1382 [Leptospira borgpetersenii serovar Hardjo-bovis str. Sponselee]|uniref:Uncharacterized protein n=1 Tax=Leptospira borgpetersenii serovar Hardjo-bovis str. Sponselee TaxID=1303729 RepID=M6BUM1_LEPBO|nr:hypothetical protein LEP1GSC016_1382 [Leptospira borgpetersenii serovar Hardjo-bovis str. Sponselee]